MTGFRNDTDVVRIVSAEWSAWLRLARGRGALNLEETRRPSPAKGRGRGAVCLVPGPRPLPRPVRARQYLRMIGSAIGAGASPKA